jgi:hypothetical protein
METEKPTSVADLSVEELLGLIRRAVNQVMDEREKLRTKYQSGLLALPPLSVGEWRHDLKLLSREEMYDDAQ